jgi:putative DNA primase/helicase
MTTPKKDTGLRHQQQPRNDVGKQAADASKSAQPDLAQSKLKQKFESVKAEPVRDSEPNGREAGNGFQADHDASELELADILISQIPPLRCVGEDWYVYANGLWRQSNKNEFKPQALAIQHPSSRTVRRATEVLRHIEFSAQVDEKEFRSCYRKTPEESILINCANGVLEITAAAVRLRPHHQSDLFTRQLAAAYHKEATAPLFEKITADNLPDPLDVELFHAFCGYILIPDCRHEASLVCHGQTGTGKSTLAHGISAALGSELVTHMSLAQISSSENKNLAKLRYAALNLSTELDAVEVGSENFKLLSSGEAIDADRKYRDSILMQTPCKLWFNANHLPHFRKGTDAELRRLHFLKFAHKPPIPDETIKDRITAERDGILRIMVRGLQRLLVTRKFPAGGQASSRTRERFEIENDPVNSFIHEHIIFDPDQQTPKTDLFEAYREFCKKHAVLVPDEDRWFFRLLYDRFHNLRESRPWIKGQRVRVIKGIILTDHIGKEDE